MIHLRPKEKYVIKILSNNKYLVKFQEIFLFIQPWSPMILNVAQQNLILMTVIAMMTAAHRSMIVQK